MLTCVYHPIDRFRVVEDDEADRLKASGVWFDSPAKATAYRNSVEQEIKDEESKSAVKTKRKGNSNERR